MLRAQLSQIAQWAGGRHVGEDLRVSGVSTATRSLLPGAMFVAIRGERVDGHDFARNAVHAGAVAVLVERELTMEQPQIVVDDTLAALGRIAASWRDRLRARVLALTGSNGKTTVKTLLHAILGAHASTHATAGNLNNEIGLPMTVLGCPEDAAYLVLEMGAGKPGDIDYLAAIARPDVSLVNNVAAAHLERMNSLDTIARTKGAIHTHLGRDGIAVINADDDFADLFRQLAGTHRRIEFSTDPKRGDLHLSATQSEGRIAIELPQGRLDCAFGLKGRHNRANALAAVGMALAVDCPAEAIARGLEQARGVAGRQTRHASELGWVIIDDSYNANPASMCAGIDVLVADAPRRAWLVLGDMAELGTDSVALHRSVGEYARKAGVQHLFAVGPRASAYVQAFGAGAEHFSDQDTLVSSLRARLEPGVHCLVKGSRSSRMDRVVEALVGHVTGGH